VVMSAIIIGSFHYKRYT